MRHVAYYYVFYSKKGENKMKYKFHVGDYVETKDAVAGRGIELLAIPKQMKIEENHAE